MSIQENLQRISDSPGNGTGLDIVIVSTTTGDQEDFWQARLEAGCGTICRSDALIVAVTEDWPGGAGNGLGTLYALRTAATKAWKTTGRDLMDELFRGASVGLYHTAGKGTRLAPLPGSEGNNKPAVKLPSTVEIAGRSEPLTILEAVVRQTALYAEGRGGRVGVFWGDQVFIPFRPAPIQATHHVDILASLGPMPDALEWEKRGLERYGLIAVGRDGNAAQVEKVTHETADSMVSNDLIAVDGGIGVSLGSFSMSAAMTVALLDEFTGELDRKQGKLDSDPHFWMPMTLDAATYRDMMKAKGTDGAEADVHFERIRALCTRLLNDHDDLGLFGCVDVGAESWWWDYGTIQGYIANNLKLLGDDEEAAGMRRFYGIDETTSMEGLDLGGNSVLIDCDIRAGRVHGSVLVGVKADTVDIEGSVMINVLSPDIQGRGLLLYDVPELGPLHLEPGTVRADTFLPDQGRIALWSNIERDGKADWSTVLPGNTLSWDDLHSANETLKRSDVEPMIRAAFEEAGRSR